MEIEDYMRMEDLRLSGPKDNLSVLTFMYIRDAKRSVGQRSDTCMPVSFPRCALQFLGLHLESSEVTRWLDLAHFQHIPFL